MAAVIVSKAGSPVNGVYLPYTDSKEFTMFRKTGSNIGLVFWEDNRWYITDCGAEFTPTGEDHIDFYWSNVQSNTSLIEAVWDLGDDGLLPLPCVRTLAASELTSYGTSSKLAAHGLAVRGDMQEAIEALRVCVSLNPTYEDYIKLAEWQSDFGDKQSAWNSLRELGTAKFLEGKLPEYTKDDRLIAVGLLEKVIPDLSGCLNVKILTDPAMKRFPEFLISKGNELLKSLSAGTSISVDSILEVASSLRVLYRQIDWFTCSEADCAITRTRVFSLADKYRRFISEGWPDLKEVEFKTFWETERLRDLTSAEAKDEDGEKELKCPVIKEALQDDVTSVYEDHRKRLLAVNDLPVIDLAYLSARSCHNAEEKLISIHGVVWDVTDNLDKYAPDGEYNFFPGNDITYPLGISSLSDEHANKFFRLTPLMLKKVYGWMSYFEGKYAVVARLKEWDEEQSFPQAEDIDANECVVM